MLNILNTVLKKQSIFKCYIGLRYKGTYRWYNVGTSGITQKHMKKFKALIN